MSARPDLRVINSDGELVQDDPLVLEHEELKRKFFGLLGENGKLRKQIAELRGLEPEAETIREILHYAKERYGKPRQEIIEGGERWEKCRARLRDKPEGRGQRTPEELKLAIDGALLEPWLNGTAPNAPKDGRYLDAKTVFKSPEQVAKLRDLALGFQAQAGVHLGDLLDVATDLQWVNWGYLLKTCGCGHRRVEHAHGDPSLEGRELCRECDCPDFDIDPFDAFNIRTDEHLRRWYGRKAA
jgi:hypothetical protein